MKKETTKEALDEIAKMEREIEMYTLEIEEDNRKYGDSAKLVVLMAKRTELKVERVLEGYCCDIKQEVRF
jgi:hypothetical protein